MYHANAGADCASSIRVLAYFNLPISLRELIVRTYRELIDDDGLGLAAQLAYYFLLALFPAILCVLAIASYFPLENIAGTIATMVQRVAPAEIAMLVRDQLVRLAQTDSGGVLSFGLLGALWSSSAAMVAIISAMNRAYDIEESRPWWKVRLTAILLTMGLAAFTVVSFVLVVTGPEIASALAGRLGLSEVFVWVWNVVQWPIAFGLIVTGVALVYYFAPDADQEWVWITPGSLVASVLWLVASLGFRFYVTNFGSYEATYGAVAGVIVLMVWLYVSGLMIVLGAELNAEIEHASPWGKAPGEKVPGQRRRIGWAAAREYWARHARPMRSPSEPLPQGGHR